MSWKYTNSASGLTLFHYHMISLLILFIQPHIAIFKLDKWHSLFILFFIFFFYLLTARQPARQPPETAKMRPHPSQGKQLNKLNTPLHAHTHTTEWTWVSRWWRSSSSWCFCLLCRSRCLRWTIARPHVRRNVAEVRADAGLTCREECF